VGQEFSSARRRLGDLLGPAIRIIGRCDDAYVRKGADNAGKILLNRRAARGSSALVVRLGAVPIESLPSSRRQLSSLDMPPEEIRQGADLER